MDEKFYEKICRAYINTVNLEWVTTNPENNNSIVHGYFLDDEAAVEQVTSENFKDFVTDEDDYYEYDTWEDFYEEYIQDSILDDLEDIGVYDDDDNWDFYITKEDLIKLELWDEEE